MIDYSGTPGLEVVSVAFAGGGPGTNSGLYLSEGTFGRVIYDYFDAHSGRIENFDAGGTNLRSAAGLTIGNDVAPFDQLTAAGAMTLAADKNLTADATSIKFSTGPSDVTLAGSGAAMLTAVQSIGMASGSSLTTVDGDISMSANAAGTEAGNFLGIELAGGTVQSTGSGAISLVGRGGSGSTGRYGVSVGSGGQVLGGNGDVTVTGTGGAGTGSDQYGVVVADGGSTITSSGGRRHFSPRLKHHVQRRRCDGRGVWWRRRGLGLRLRRLGHRRRFDLGWRDRDRYRNRHRRFWFGGFQ
ncbi:MAG: hypothetical protein MUF25_17880 [Pirellulaceae bacterium]|nr:hypothetical protein [Pirellulaceae bacterium]